MNTNCVGHTQYTRGTYGSDTSECEKLLTEISRATDKKILAEEIFRCCAKVIKQQKKQSYHFVDNMLFQYGGMQIFKGYTSKSTEGKKTALQTIAAGTSGHSLQ